MRMASLYKKPIVATDPKTGQKVKTKSKKWWGRFRGASGTVRRVPLATDKMAAQAMLNDLVQRAEREKAEFEGRKPKARNQGRSRPVKAGQGESSPIKAEKFSGTGEQGEASGI